MLNQALDSLVEAAGSGSPTRSARLVPKLSFSPPSVRRRDGDREPPLERGDAVDLPAADQRVLHAGRVAGDLLPLAERQVVDEAADEPVIDVEVREPAIELRIGCCSGGPASR